MCHYYLNDDHSYTPCDLETWGKQIQELSLADKKHVAYTELDGKRISTVWMGLDHNFRGGRPLLFETMVFAQEDSDWHGSYQERYTTWDEALEGHQKAIQWVRDGCKDD